MIHTIVTPAARFVPSSGASTFFTGLIAVALIFSYHQWIRPHMWQRITHFVDLLCVVIAIGAGVSFAASWPGRWSHSVFAWIAGIWNGNGRTGGDEWVTIAALLLTAFIVGAILKIAKREHRGPVASVLAMVVLLPVVLVSTQGAFGQHAMQALVKIARPIDLQGW